MKKTIIKTAIITFVSAILFVSLLFGAFALWCPKIIGNMSNAFNNYGGTIWGYERQYNKYGSFEDLQFLVYKLNEESDASKTAIYSQKMIEHNNFDNYCNSKDKSKTSTQMTEREYVYKKCTVSLINIGEFSKAMEMANTYYSQKGYTAFNPYRAIATKKDKLSTEQKLQLVAKLEIIKLTLTDQTQKTNITADILLLAD